jgi:hypothetical protein
LFKLAALLNPDAAISGLPFPWAWLSMKAA